MVVSNKVRTKSGLLFTAGKELSLNITLDMVMSNKVRTKGGLLFAAGKELSLTLP